MNDEENPYLNKLISDIIDGRSNPELSEDDWRKIRELKEYFNSTPSTPAKALTSISTELSNLSNRFA